MGVLETLKSLVSGSEQQSTYSYRCQECGHGFESTVPNPNDTDWPECADIRISSRFE